MQIFSRNNQAENIQVYALHDSAAASFAMPMFFASEGLAIRALGDAVNGGDKSITSHPTAFGLHKIGEYNPLTGLFKAQAPELIIMAASLVK